MGGCSLRSGAPSPIIHAAYSLLAPARKGETLLYARLIVDGVEAQCPQLLSEDRPIPTSARKNPNPAQFPVTVCEAIIPFQQAFHLSGNRATIAAASRDPSKIVLFGDSGCKQQQCPEGEIAHPLNSLATEAGKQPVDLIVHLGDYNYRGTAGHMRLSDKKVAVYDAGDNAPTDSQCQLNSDYYSQNGAGSSVADNWQDWRDDFFRPAQPLLSKAPWLFSRGNHELCSRAGPGWFYFLGPGSDLKGAGVAQLSCPIQGSVTQPDRDVLSHLKFVQPYTVTFDKLQLLVMDSANACDGYAPGVMTERYVDQISQLSQSASESMPTWMVTHRPFWGLLKENGASVNKTLQSALDNPESSVLTSKVELLLSGHMHLFQSLTFDHNRPPQLIVGNSGVKLVTKATTGSFNDQVDQQKANVTTVLRFGYMTIAYNSDGSWRGSVGSGDNSIVECNSAHLPGALCQLINETD